MLTQEELDAALATVAAAQAALEAQMAAEAPAQIAARDPLLGVETAHYESLLSRNPLTYGD